MRSIGLFIQNENGEFNRVELYNDEKITITSSIQDIADISKTKTDFSQSFSVPATATNNKTFAHWHENAIDNGYSHLTKKSSYIEIDTLPFRTGLLQLEGVDMENEQPVNYRLTFFGSLVSLKDLFAGLSLKDLTNSTGYDFLCSPALISTLISSTTASNIMFPLISSKRAWAYNGIDPINNVDTTTGAIKYDELTPAIKVKAVFLMIATQFGITFNGDFLNDDRFLNLYLWLKNSDVFDYRAEPKKNTFDTENYTGYVDEWGFTPTNSVVFNNANDNFVLKDNGQIKTVTFEINNTGGAVGVPFTVYLYKNGVVYSQAAGVTVAAGAWKTYVLMDKVKTTGDVYDIRLAAKSNMTYSSKTVIKSLLPSTATAGSTTLSQAATSTQTITQAQMVYVTKHFPDMKIEDFFTGILSLFNLTCYSTAPGVYTIEQIENYYASGNIINITKYVLNSPYPIDRVKSFKRVAFTYQKGENFLAESMTAASGKNYGDLTQDFNADGAEYPVKLPFELLSWQDAGNSNLYLAYALKSGYVPYVPKPVLMYLTAPATGETAAPFYFDNGTTKTSKTVYNAFTNEYLVSSTPYNQFNGLAFNNEGVLMANGAAAASGLYQCYYQNYLQNVFNIKARSIKVKAVLPLSIITTLRLKDRLIIRDKRYIINSFVTDLTTLEVSFDLITDLRQL